MKRFPAGRYIASASLVIFIFLPGGAAVAKAPPASPGGIRLGSFLASPQLELQTSYEDNIYNTARSTSFDFITTVKPAVALESDWERHAVFIGGEGDFGFYKRHDGENYADYKASVSGEYEIAEETALNLALSRGKQHRQRGDFLENNNRNLDYTVITKAVSFRRELSYIQLRLEAREEDYLLFEDSNPALAGMNDYRRRGNRDFKARLAYEYMPDNEIFVQAKYSATDYALMQGGERDSDGYDWRLGWQFNNARGLNMVLFGGLLSRNFEMPGADDVNELYWGGSVYWQATPLTAFNLLIEKTFADTTSNGTSGALRTIRKLTARHEFNQDITGEASLGVDSYDYVGGGNDGNDALAYYGGVAAEYQLRPEVALRGGFEHRTWRADRALDDYRDNRLFLSLIYSPAFPEK